MIFRYLFNHIQIFGTCHAFIALMSRLNGGHLDDLGVFADLFSSVAVMCILELSESSDDVIIQLFDDIEESGVCVQDVSNAELCQGLKW